MAARLTDLPQEVVNLIATFLERREDQSDIPSYQRVQTPSKLPPYATISRPWQYAIESITFREMSLNNLELQFFSRIMVQHRCAMLRDLEFEIILPTYSDKACAKFETEKDKQANNQVFSEAVKSLLNLLRFWYDSRRKETNDIGSRGETPLRLCLGNCYSPMDGRHRGKTKYKEDSFNRAVGKRHDLFDGRYEFSLLKLQSFDNVKEVPQICRFDKFMGEDRRVEPRSIALIASKLPNLESVNWTLYDNEKKSPHLRQQARYDFAKALSFLHRNSLTRFSLELYYETPSDQSRNASSVLIPSLPTTDHLSRALHEVSQSVNLTDLTLGMTSRIIISESLFWSEDQTRRPYWPSLLFFSVDFSMVAPDGDWYFIRSDKPREEGDDEDIWSPCLNQIDDEEESDTEIYSDSDVPDTYNEVREQYAVGDLPFDQFRTKADPGKIDPFYAAAARAATQMPRLRKMFLETEVEGRNSFSFGMSYWAPGEASSKDGGPADTEIPGLDWDVGPSGYVPEESTIEIWRQAKGVDGRILSRIVEI